MKFMILCSTYYVFSCMKQNKYLYFWDFVIIYKKDIKVKNLLIFRYWKGEKNKYDRREGHLFIKCAIQ